MENLRSNLPNDEANLPKLQNDLPDDEVITML